MLINELIQRTRATLHTEEEEHLQAVRIQLHAAERRAIEEEERANAAHVYGKFTQPAPAPADTDNYDLLVSFIK